MATLGRQRHLGDRHTLVSMLKKSGYEVHEDSQRRLLDPTELYCEEFFSLLGSKEIIAVDVSAFEGAQFIHDMNLPIPDALDSAFDVVLDGGTLEHIFDLPMALRNAARMVRPNGRFISVTEANNFCGHGFYQFSPELFYRFFCPDNGYVMDSCILWEDIPGTDFYQVPDPDAVHHRINLTSEFGTYMVVQAQRQGDLARDFVPQQSDYVRLWNSHSGKPAPSNNSPDRLSSIKSRLKQIPALRNAVQSAREAARYRRLSVKRNVDGDLTPLKDLQAIR
jgi:SAM-dependent methyltransferase